MIGRGFLRREYEQRHGAGMYLGRHMELDGRSLAFTVPEEAHIAPHEWLPSIPTLDQGSLGSCTGNAGTYALSARYGSDLGKILLNKLGLGADARANEQFAVELYHQATVADGIAGAYPPDDTGSSGLAVCRVLKRNRLITRYAWATTARAFASLLQRGGCIIGMPWYEAFFRPDQQGFIDAGAWQSSPLAGGHEVYVEALESWDDGHPDDAIIRFANSWTDSWGDHGRGRMRLSTYQALRSEIDVKQIIV